MKKLYRATNCSNCLRVVEIALTPEEIQKKLEEYSGVEIANRDFFANVYNDEDTDYDEDNISILAQYSTTIRGECEDGCAAPYCLVLVQMRFEIPFCDDCGESGVCSFDLQM